MSTCAGTTISLKACLSPRLENQGSCPSSVKSYSVSLPILSSPSLFLACFRTNHGAVFFSGGHEALGGNLSLINRQQCSFLVVPHAAGVLLYSSIVCFNSPLPSASPGKLNFPALQGAQGLRIPAQVMLLPPYSMLSGLGSTPELHSAQGHPLWVPL